MAHRKGECKNCSRVKWIAGRGMCGACYARLQRRGTLERKNAINQGRICKKAECNRPAFAKGFCSHHYQKAQHPLKTMWKLLRSRVGESRFPETWNEFEVFLEEVGERPSTRHQLRRLDPNKPYSVTNVHWQPPVLSGDHNDKAYSKAWNLKKYGLTVGEYEQRLAGQGGVCAACRKPEESQGSHRSGPRALVVDHCHKTEASGTMQDAIRGLLCNRCNRLLGLARDDADLLRSLAVYLDDYRLSKSA